MKELKRGRRACIHSQDEGQTSMHPLSYCIARNLGANAIGLEAHHAPHNEHQAAQEQHAPLKSYLPQWLSSFRFPGGPTMRHKESPEALANVHGQAQKDTFAVRHYFHNMHDGIFLEMGALDGIWGSNTLFFEKERGWRKLLIEPNTLVKKERGEEGECSNEKFNKVNSTLNLYMCRNLTKYLPADQTQSA